MSDCAFKHLSSSVSRMDLIWNELTTLSTGIFEACILFQVRHVDDLALTKFARGGSEGQGILVGAGAFKSGQCFRTRITRFIGRFLMYLQRFCFDHRSCRL